MPLLHTILAVELVESFCVTCLWNTGELRKIDFKKYIRGDNKRLHGLADKTAFENVKAVDGTLQWPQILQQGYYKGKLVDQPLMMDPDVLYKDSEQVGLVVQTALSYSLRQARLKAGMSQIQLAERTGTTKNYISRLESGIKGFQVATYDRILKDGFGNRVDVGITIELKKPTKKPIKKAIAQSDKQIE